MDGKTEGPSLPRDAMAGLDARLTPVLDDESRHTVAPSRHHDPGSGQTDHGNPLPLPDIFDTAAAGAFPATSKDEPTNMSTPTGIHAFSGYPPLQSAIADEGDVFGAASGVASGEMDRNLEKSLGLPQSENVREVEDNPGDGAVDGGNTEAASTGAIGSGVEDFGAPGSREIDADVGKICDAVGDSTNREAPDRRPQASHHPEAHSDMSADGGATIGPSRSNMDAPDATGMTACSEPFTVDAVLGEGNILDSTTNTGHISHNAAATQSMIAQGTSFSGPTERADHRNGNTEDVGGAVDKHGSQFSAGCGSRSEGEDHEPIQMGRVDASTMEVLDNPLSKSDRYTVIKGRLPDSDPFMRAAKNLGKVFLSAEMKQTHADVLEKDLSEEERADNFMRDIEAFNKELNRDFKIPIIGGGQLSLYALALEVMKLGGLRNVVLNRAFRIVGQQLELPKSCTSAAFVLKNAYEKLLYQYEQKLAFGINPSHPQRTIDIKSLVSESKKRGEGSRSRSRKHGPTPSGGRFLGPAQDFHGRISKRPIGHLDSATARQMEAVREAAQKELYSADPAGNVLRRSVQECPNLLGGYSGMDVELLTPQAPESTSTYPAAPLPEGTLPNHEWRGAPAVAQAVDLLGQPTSANSEDVNPGQTTQTALQAQSLAAARKPETQEQRVYAVFGGDESVQALQMAAKVLHTLRIRDSSKVKLGEMRNGAGATLLSSIVQVFSKYLEALRTGGDGGWRAVVARCAGEILRILLFVQENQVFCATAARLWRVIIDILASDGAEDPVVSSLWTAVSVMGPYLPVTIEGEALVELLHIASEHLGRASGSAAQIAWFISGSLRGMTAKMGEEHDQMVERIFSSLSACVGGGSPPLKHATLTALLHLSRVYPEMAGSTGDLVYTLIKELTAENTGGLAASTLYYVCQANASALKGFEDFLLTQTRRVVSARPGTQNSDQIVAILSLLTGGAATMTTV